MTPTPDPGTAWQVVLTLAVLLAVGVNLLALHRSGKTTATRIEPNPVEVRKLDAYITRDFHATCHEAMTSRVARVEGEVAAIRSEMRADREVSTARILTEVKGVHDRVNHLELKVGEVLGHIHRTS
jgi:hypothetical protein